MHVLILSQCHGRCYVKASTVRSNSMNKIKMRPHSRVNSTKMIISTRSPRPYRQHQSCRVQFHAQTIHTRWQPIMRFHSIRFRHQIKPIKLRKVSDTNRTLRGHFYSCWIVNINSFFVPFLPIADHHEELFYICLLFSVALFVLLSSIMIVIGRIVLNKRHQQNSNESSVSETAAGVAAMTKLPTEDTTASATTSTVVTNAVADENTSDDIDIDLTTAITISSISNRNNVRTTSLSPQLDAAYEIFRSRASPVKTNS